MILRSRQRLQTSLGLKSGRKDFSVAEKCQICHSKDQGNQFIQEIRETGREADLAPSLVLPLMAKAPGNKGLSAFLPNSILGDLH